VLLFTLVFHGYRTGRKLKKKKAESGSPEPRPEN
jgi:hypothetical protein